MNLRPREITSNAKIRDEILGIEKGGREGKMGVGWKKQEEGINCGREFVASLKYPPLSRTSDESHAGRRALSSAAIVIYRVAVNPVRGVP